MIPVPWCKNNEDQLFAHWPPRKTENIMELIKDCQPPDESWPVSMILESTPEFDSYETAVAFEKVILTVKSVSRGYEQKMTSVMQNKRVIFPKSLKQPGESTTEDETSSQKSGKHISKPPKRAAQADSQKSTNNKIQPKKLKPTTNTNEKDPKSLKGKKTPGLPIKTSSKSTNSDQNGSIKDKEKEKPTLLKKSTENGGLTGTSKSTDALLENQSSAPKNGPNLAPVPMEVQVVSGQNLPSSSKDNVYNNTEEDFLLGNVIASAPTVAILNEFGIPVNANVEITSDSVSKADFEKFRQETIEHLSKVILSLKTVIANQKIIMEGMMNNQVVTRPPVEMYECPIRLPVTKLEQLAELNNLLRNDVALRSHLVNQFSGLLTKDLGDFVRKNLAKIMVNNVGKVLSWKGMKGKNKFIDYANIVSLLRETAELVPGRFDESAFTHEISIWLSQAGRRKQEPESEDQDNDEIVGDQSDDDNSQ